MIKNIYKNPTAKVILNGEKLIIFPLASDTRKGYPFPPLLFTFIQEILAKCNKKKK